MMFFNKNSIIQIIMENPNLRSKTPNIITIIKSIIAPIIKDLPKNHKHYQKVHYLY